MLMSRSRQEVDTWLLREEEERRQRQRESQSVDRDTRQKSLSTQTHTKDPIEIHTDRHLEIQTGLSIRSV